MKKLSEILHSKMSDLNEDEQQLKRIYQKKYSRRVNDEGGCVDTSIIDKYRATSKIEKLTEKMGRLEDQLRELSQERDELMESLQEESNCEYSDDDEDEPVQPVVVVKNKQTRKQPVNNTPRRLPTPEPVKQTVKQQTKMPAVKQPASNKENLKKRLR